MRSLSIVVVLMTFAGANSLRAEAPAQGLGSDCSTASCSDCPADFDLDGDVDAFDLANLLGDWGDCPAP